MIDPNLRDQLDALVQLCKRAFKFTNAQLREQLTYLIFLRLLDIEEQRREEGREGVLGVYHDAPHDYRLFPPGEEGLALRWHHVIAMPETEMFKHLGNAVFPFLRKLGNRQEQRGLACLRDARFFWPGPEHLKEIMSMLNRLPFDGDRELCAQLFEHLLARLEPERGERHVLRPSAALCRVMVELLLPEPTDVIADLNCCAEESFVAVLEYLRRAHFNPEQSRESTEGDEEGDGTEDFPAEYRTHISKDMFHGFVLDAGHMASASMRLMLHGIRGETIIYADILNNSFKEHFPSFAHEAFDRIFCIPYFEKNDSLDVAIELLRQIKSRDTQTLFILRLLQMLKPHGRAVVVVSRRLLSSVLYDFSELKRILIENKILESVIFLPNSFFSQHPAMQCCILVINKNEVHDQVFLHNIEESDASTSKTMKTNEIATKIISDWKSRALFKDADRKGDSFFVSIEEVRENKYILDIRNYKQHIYKPDEYEEPIEIIRCIEKMNNEITREITELMDVIQ